jgi:hypothetical protein
VDTARAAPVVRAGARFRCVQFDEDQNGEEIDLARGLQK